MQHWPWRPWPQSKLKLKEQPKELDLSDHHISLLSSDARFVLCASDIHTAHTAWRELLLEKWPGQHTAKKVDIKVLEKIISPMRTAIFQGLAFWYANLMHSDMWDQCVSLLLWSNFTQFHKPSQEDDHYCADNKFYKQICNRHKWWSAIGINDWLNYILAELQDNRWELCCINCHLHLDIWVRLKRWRLATHLWCLTIEARWSIALAWCGCCAMVRSTLWCRARSTHSRESSSQEREPSQHYENWDLKPGQKGALICKKRLWLHSRPDHCFRSAWNRTTLRS